MTPEYNAQVAGYEAQMNLQIQAKLEEVCKNSALQDEVITLRDLLNEIYVFVAARHHACDPWRIALDDWQKRVEAQTGWDAFEQVEKFNATKS